jgi:hypothetical protein
VFARLAIEKTGSEPTARVAFILRRVLQRVPTEAEIERGVKFLATSQEGEKMTAEEALRRFCLLALNLNEFVYLE